MSKCKNIKKCQKSQTHWNVKIVKDFKIVKNINNLQKCQYFEIIHPFLVFCQISHDHLQIRIVHFVVASIRLAWVWWLMREMLMLIFLISCRVYLFVSAVEFRVSEELLNLAKFGSQASTSLAHLGWHSRFSFNPAFRMIQLERDSILSPTMFYSRFLTCFYV